MRRVAVDVCACCSQLSSARVYCSARFAAVVAAGGVSHHEDRRAYDESITPFRTLMRPPPPPIFTCSGASYARRRSDIWHEGLSTGDLRHQVMYARALANNRRAPPCPPLVAPNPPAHDFIATRIMVFRRHRAAQTGTQSPSVSRCHRADGTRPCIVQRAVADVASSADGVVVRIRLCSAGTDVARARHLL